MGNGRFQVEMKKKRKMDDVINPTNLLIQPGLFCSHFHNEKFKSCQQLNRIQNIEL